MKLRYLCNFLVIFHLYEFLKHNGNLLNVLYLDKDQYDFYFILILIRHYSSFNYTYLI